MRPRSHSWKTPWSDKNFGLAVGKFYAARQKYDVIFQIVLASELKGQFRTFKEDFSRQAMDG